ncbi:hypothetical protein D049_3827A, partial [Vibrio parahaemolyticus VPTS-2010]
MQLG